MRYVITGLWIYRINYRSMARIFTRLELWYLLLGTGLAIHIISLWFTHSSQVYLSSAVAVLEITIASETPSRNIGKWITVIWPEIDNIITMIVNICYKINSFRALLEYKDWLTYLL